MSSLSLSLYYYFFYIYIRSSLFEDPLTDHIAMRYQICSLSLEYWYSSFFLSSSSLFLHHPLSLLFFFDWPLPVCVLTPAFMTNHPTIDSLISDTAMLSCTEPNVTSVEPFKDEYTFIAHILTNKPTNTNAFRATMIKPWNLKGKHQTNLLQQNTRAFILESH